MEIKNPHEFYCPARMPNAQLDEGVDFMGVLIILARKWRRTAAITLAALIMGIAVAFVLPPTFTATASILVPQQASSTLSMLSQLSSMAGGIAAGGFGMKSAADTYIGMLQSRTVADHVIQECDLKHEYRTKTLEDTRVALRKHVEIDTGKDTLIHLSVKDGDPNKASKIANSYLKQLHDLNSKLVTGEASERRSFYEQRLAEEQDALNEAEVALRNTQQKTGLIQLNGQAAAVINGIAQARAQLAGREVELQSIKTYATEENPNTIRLENEIAALKNNLAQLENSQSALPPGDIQLPAGRVPEAALLYERRLRDVKYHEALFELLSKQLEAARLDEAKSAPILQVVDHAVPPDKKSGPPRKLIAAGAAFLGLFLACLWSLAEAALDRMQKDPEKAQQLNELRSAIFRR